MFYQNKQYILGKKVKLAVMKLKMFPTVTNLFSFKKRYFFFFSKKKKLTKSF